MTNQKYLNVKSINPKGPTRPNRKVPSVQMNQSQALLPNVVKDIHNAVIYCESDGNIEHYPAKPGHGTLVEAEWTLRLPGLDEAIPCVLVLRCLETLHSSFDYVYWCVAEY